MRLTFQHIFQYYMLNRRCEPLEFELIKVTGDDTKALQSVLDADVWRKYLLREQDEILEQLNHLDATAPTTEHGTISDPKLDRERKTLDSRLTEVHEKLFDIPECFTGYWPCVQSRLLKEHRICGPGYCYFPCKCDKFF